MGKGDMSWWHPIETGGTLGCSQCPFNSGTNWRDLFEKEQEHYDDALQMWRGAEEDIKVLRQLGDQLANAIMNLYPNNGMPKEVAVLLATWEVWGETNGDR